MSQIRHVADHQVDRIFGFGLEPDDVKRRPAVIGLQEFFRAQQLQQLDDRLALERMIRRPTTPVHQRIARCISSIVMGIPAVSGQVIRSRVC
jgi:hypothetical protein